MLNAQCSINGQRAVLKAQSMDKAIEHFVCIDMEQTKLTPSGKPFDIHERLQLFACDIVRLTQFLHTRGPIARRISYQILDAGTSVGSDLPGDFRTS
jgi:hypothetical protein